MNVFRKAGAAVFLTLITHGPAHGGAIESSYRAARNIIEASVEAMEVGWWMKKPAPLMIVASGTLNMGAEHQGYAPSDPSPSSFSETWAYDPATGRAGREYKQFRRDGSVEWMKEIFEPDGSRWYVDLYSDRAFREPPQLAGDARDANLRRLPALLLSEALNRPESLRGLGRYGPFDAVQARTGGGISLSLFFGRESHLLGWIEYLVDLPSFPDTSVTWRLSDYRRVFGAGMLPYQYQININESLYLDMDVSDISTDSAAVKSFLEIPANRVGEDRELPLAWTPWMGAELVEAGRGLWLVRNLRTGFHMFFVEFDNYLLAVDAPSGYPLLQELPAGNVIGDFSEDSLTRKAVELVSERVPGKPVRYAVMTHFHSDHVGGVFGFDPGQTTLIVSEADQEAMRTFLDGPHTLCGERPQNTPRIRAVDRRRVIADGTQRVEILDVGANPHTGSMLVIWLPEQRVLYVSDLLTAWDDKPDTGHEKMNRFLLDWVKKRHLDPEVIYTAHGSGRVLGPRTVQSGD